MKKMIKYLPIVLLLGACQTDENISDAYGTLEATEIFIASELPGKIMQMTADEGTIVDEGVVLARIDTTGLFLQKEQVKASMNALKAKLTDVPVQLDVLRKKEQILKRELDRIGELVQNGAATSKQLDDLNGEYDVVRKQLAASKSQLSTANRAILAQMEPMEWQLKTIDDKIIRTVIVSPKNGTVLKRYKEPGEITAPGTPLFKIADLTAMIARVYVTGSQLQQIKIGQEVSVKTDQNSSQMIKHPGKILWISDRAEFTPKTIQTKEERVNQVYAVKIAVSNPEGQLKIGMPVEIDFE
jgi:HlyD family secretion protein